MSDSFTGQDLDFLADSANNLGGEVLFDEDFDLPIYDNPAMVLQGRDLEKFTHWFDSLLSESEERMMDVHDSAIQARKIYKLYDKESAYDGAPNHTLPITQNRVDGVTAHLRDAIEQNPLVAFTPLGTGPKADLAREIAPLCEQLLEREINVGGSRQDLVAYAPLEAAKTGTAVLEFSLATHPNGERFIQTKIIKIEDFFTDNPNVEDISDNFVAYRYQARYHRLKEQALEGILDLEAVDMIRGSYSGGETISEQDPEVLSSIVSEELRIHTLYKGWVRFTKEGETLPILYEAIFSKHNRKILSVRHNSIADVQDSPPIQRVRIKSQSNMYFGMSISEILKSIQNWGDESLNTHIAQNQLAAAPPFLYNKNNPIARALARDEPLRPGQGIPNYGPPNSRDIVTIEFQNNGLAIGDVGIANSLAEQATYNDAAIGGNSDGRKTWGQFRTEFNLGTLRLRMNLSDFSYDMSDCLIMMWKLVKYHKIRPQGIIQVDGGKLLGFEEIQVRELLPVMYESIAGMLQSGELIPADVIALAQDFSDLLTEGIVPSVNSADFSIGLSGTRIIADKVTEAAKLERFTPYLNLLEMAKIDTRIWYHLKTYLVAMGLNDWQKRIGSDPGQQVLSPEEYNNAMGTFNQVQMKSAIM